MSDIDIGQITEALNDKADRDMVNTIPPYLVSRTPNNQGGVIEIWSDGYCVQTGTTSTQAHSGITINLPQSYINTNYIITEATTNITTSAYSTNIDNITVSSFKITSNFRGQTSQGVVNWQAKGYIR